MITYWLTGRKICNLNTSYEVKDEVWRMKRLRVQTLSMGRD
jgi:hypothetical protein